MSKHTPGPWKVLLDTDIYDDSYGLIAATFAVGSPAVRAANARLIAAAPELLEALLLHRRKGHHDTCSHALVTGCACDCGFEAGETAISKAIGGSK